MHKNSTNAKPAETNSVLISKPGLISSVIIDGKIRINEPAAGSDIPIPPEE